MGAQMRCRLAAAGARNKLSITALRTAVVAGLVLCGEAFIDIRAPPRTDAAKVEAQPQEQVHLVFSSHLVSYGSLHVFLNPLQDLRCMKLIRATVSNLREILDW